LVLSALFVRALHPGVVARGAMRVVFACGAVMGLAIVATPARVFTEGIPILELAAVALAAYLIIALGRSALAGERTAAFMLGGLLVFIASVTHDIAFVKYPWQSDLAPYGALVLISTPAVVLARRFSRALSNEQLRLVEQRQRVDLLVRATKAGLLDWETTTGVITYSERYKE